MEWKYPLMGIVETVTDVPCSIDKDMNKESISNWKRRRITRGTVRNGKT